MRRRRCRSSRRRRWASARVRTSARAELPGPELGVRCRRRPSVGDAGRCPRRSEAQHPAADVVRRPRGTERGRSACRWNAIDATGVAGRVRGVDRAVVDRLTHVPEPRRRRVPYTVQRGAVPACSARAGDRRRLPPATPRLAPSPESRSVARRRRHRGRLAAVLATAAEAQPPCSVAVRACASTGMRPACPKRGGRGRRRSSASGRAPCRPVGSGFEAFGARAAPRGVVERRELGADDPAEQQVGECRVAGQHRAVQVGADESVAEHAVDAARSPLPPPTQTRPSGSLAGTERRAAAVVLEAGERRERPALGVGLDHDLADQARRPGDGRHVDEPEPSSTLAVARPRSVWPISWNPAHTAKITAPPRTGALDRRPRRRASPPRPSPAGRPRRRRRGRRRATRGSASPAATSTSSASMPRRRQRSTSTTALPRSP